MVQDLGIEPSEDRLQNNAAYIQSWKDEIKENPNALFTAIADADKIARYVSSKEQAYRQTKDVEYYAIVEETNAYSEQVYRCYTEKPVPLLEYLIKTYTQEGDVVLDNCMGSGSTGVACKNTNRNFIGIEKERKYFEIAQNRIYN